MKKEYYYKGKALLSGEILGHCFCLVENIEKLLCFKGKGDYVIGGIYSMDVNLKTNKIKLGGYCDKDCKEEELIKQWKIESSKNQSDFEYKRINKKLSKESADLENMTLREIKERVKNNRMFRKLILFYLWRGGLL